MIGPLVVLDTNIIVSALRVRGSVPALVVAHTLEFKLFRPALSDSILAEYMDVLRRPKFKFSEAAVNTLLKALRDQAVYPRILPEHRCQLNDKSDECFAECAIAARAILVTGNIRHFSPVAERCRVMSPRELLDSHL